MSERTTIGGTVYEAIGSSSSNLLLKCNGTARIQWGGKLIDLIKNGKIASGDSQELIFIVKDKSDIKSDGIYVLTTEESDQLWISKDGNKYDLTGTDLYISASKKQELTVEQKKQALDNIGMYYNTLADVQSAGIKDGIVYVTDTKTLYTIKNGTIEEFEAKLKTVTVEKESIEGEVINSSVKIVLSILDEEYLVLADQRITANYSIHVKNSAQIGSESADKTQGYRLYIDGNTSYLDVDEINVRNGIKVIHYKELTFEELNQLIQFENLEPNSWYLITDFQNHWKLSVYNEEFNRPILIRALDNKNLYKKGFLFKNHKVEIHYDPTYQEIITQRNNLDGVNVTESDVITRGRITWMKDEHNNEANFDFLDYTDAEGNELTTLHFHELDINQDKSYDKSIFPTLSYNNKLIIYDLKGTVINNKVIDNTNTNVVDFQFNDDEGNYIEMYNNYIECRGFTLTPECLKFYNNNLQKSIKIIISNYFCNNNFGSIYYRNDLETINWNLIKFSELNNSDYTSIQFLYETKNIKCLELINCIFENSLKDCSFEVITSCVLKSEFKNSIFKELFKCEFNEGTIKDVESFYNLNEFIFNQNDYQLLYNTEKRKEIYINNENLQIICIPDSIFYRGMIIMHSGIEPIPKGWAPCDGGEYEWNGVISTTPDLKNRFIKAVATVEEIKAGNNTSLNENGELVLTTDNLPKHSHPHYSHSHSFSGNSSDSFTVLTEASEGNVITSIEGGTEGKAITSVTSSTISVYSEGTSSEYSTETGWQYKEQPDPIKIEPNYYSLIFIMKL